MHTQIQDTRRTAWFEDHFAKKITNLDREIDRLEEKRAWALAELKKFNTSDLRRLVDDCNGKIRKLKSERAQAYIYKNRGVAR